MTTATATPEVTAAPVAADSGPQTLARRLIASPVARFLLVGGVSTLGYLALYALLRLELSAQVANVLALLATGDVNTFLNRRWTFGFSGRTPVGQRAKGVVSYLVSLVATSSALALLQVLAVEGRTAEYVALVVANVVAGVAHYALLRSWAFTGPRR